MGSANQTVEERNWNREMSRHRITVEWGLGRVKKLFSMMKNKLSLKCLLSPVAVYWFNYIFLTNLHTCINRHCQVPRYFDMAWYRLLWKNILLYRVCEFSPKIEPK